MSTISLLGCSTSLALAMGPTDEEEMYFFLILEFKKKKNCPCSVYYRYINLWKTHLGNVSVPLERDLHVLYHGQKRVFCRWDCPLV